jgi:membrane protein YdbS with pleckstrin-like domain
MNKQEIMAIERPHINLLKLYLIRAALTLPFFVIVFPPMLVRYLTLRYTFDEESITMRWGFLFRREVHITYSRIQDLHINCGILQRWLGLADILIQTASGNSSAEVQIEGLMQYDEVRDYLYSKMRGTEVDSPAADEVAPEDEVLNLLGGILEEMRGIKSAMRKLAGDEPELEPVVEEVKKIVPPPLQVDNTPVQNVVEIVEDTSETDSGEEENA